MAAALIAIGAVLLVAGAALYDLRAGVLTLALLTLAAGVDLARSRQ